MKIIDMNLMSTGKINYLPLFIQKDYMYFIKQNLEQNSFECKDGEYKTIYDGFFKYNLVENLMKPIFASKKIIHYFWCNDSTMIYYLTIENKECKQVITFFSLDNDNGVEKELFDVKLENYLQNNDEIGDIVNISILDIMSQVVPFAFNDNYICYKIDKINKNEGYYNCLDDANEFQLFIYDLHEEKAYQILDKRFCKNGFEYIKVCKINDKEHIVFNSSLYEETDKYEYMYNSNADNYCSMRGAVDGIYTIPLEVLINEVKQGKQNISYNIIQTIGPKGSIRLIGINGSQIYYKVNYFDNNISEFVTYDIYDQSYNRRKIRFSSNFLGVTHHATAAYVYDKEYECILELSGNMWEKERELRIQGRFVGVVESNYLIMEETDIINDELVYFGNIYDIRTLELINRTKGRPFVFDEKNIVIIC